MPLHVQTDASGAMPTGAEMLSPQPRIGVTPDGALLVSVTDAPTVTAWGAATATTSAVGATYVALASHVATKVILVNPSSALDYRRVGTSTFAVLPANTALAISLIANTNELELRRSDNSNTQIVVSYI